MISITTTQADGLRPFVVEELPSSSFGTLYSRVSRVATLDGGSVVVNSGASESDRTITVEALVSEEQGEHIEAIRANNPMAHMSTRAGFYRGAIDSISVDGGALKLTFLVQQKVNYV